MLDQKMCRPEYGGSFVHLAVECFVFVVWLLW